MEISRFKLFYFLCTIYVYMLSAIHIKVSLGPYSYQIFIKIIIEGLMDFLEASKAL